MRLDPRERGATPSAEHPASLSRLPQVIEPMLAVSAAEPFDSAAHVFEVLWDGLRILAFAESGHVRLQDCYGRDVTHRFPELAGLPSQLRTSGVVLDGEIVALEGSGRPNFARLCHRLSEDNPAEARRMATESPVTFQAFDLLYRDHQPVTGWSLRRRKDMLKTLFRADGFAGVPDFVPRDGVAFFEAAREHKLAGIVAKEWESRYLPGQRSVAWLAMRTQQKDEFVIGGFTYGSRGLASGAPARQAQRFASLLLGAYDGEARLRYVGEVTGGFAEINDSQSAALLDDLVVQDCPFVPEPSLGRLVFWCRPDLCATVRYAQWTPDRRLRFPVFECLRPDVPPGSCVLPHPEDDA